MDKLEKWFNEDCSSADAMSQYEIYIKGYNRAQIEILECQSAEAKARVNQFIMQEQLNKTYREIGIYNYE
jgi:hypothetical protein